MVPFSLLDWIWVGAFMVWFFSFGFLFTRLASRSQEDFFIAGRNLPWWMPAISVYGTHTATDTPIWMGGTLYRHGARGIWYLFTMGWCALSSFFSIKVFKRSLAYTQAEYQTLRFGGLPAELLRGWLAGWQVFMNMFVLGWVGIAMGKVCNMVFDWPLWMGMVIFTLIIGVYTMVAGYWGVVVGDLQQGTIMFLLIVFVAAYGIMGAGGIDGVRASLAAMGESWRLNPFHFDAFNATDPNNFSLFWLITMIIILVFGGLGMGTHVDYYPDAQRAASTKSIRDASYSIWGGGMLIIIRNSIWVAMVLAFFVLLPALNMSNPTSGYDMSFYWIGFKFLPAGLVGFFFAGILAVHISTIDTHINLGAEYATRDIYHHYINPNATEKQLVRVGRIATILIMLGSFVFGLMVGEDFVGWLLFAMWFLSAAIWLPQLLQVLWWRFNGWGYLTAMVVNLGVSWLIAWVLPALGVIPTYNEAVRFWLMMIISAIIYLPATLLTKPEDMDHLVMFYTMTRPPGFWGPVREEAVKRGLIKE